MAVCLWTGVLSGSRTAHVGSLPPEDQRGPARTGEADEDEDEDEDRKSGEQHLIAGGTVDAGREEGMA